VEKSLFDLPHAEARALLRAGAPVFLPVNPVEYHGPHLSLHNDRLVAEGIARDVHARLARSHPEWPLVIASDLEVGVDATPGPGTRTMPFAVVRDTVLRACRALHSLGARSVVAMTWHGAPLHSIAIEPGLAWLRRRGVAALNPFNAAFRELCRLDGGRFARAFDHVEDRALREEMIATLRYDFHGGFFETSMALHYAPESVSPNWRDVAPCPPIAPDAGVSRAARLARAWGRDELADELAMVAQSLGWHALDPFPGYTGRPHLARAESGAVFAEVVADGYATLIDDVIARRAAAPSPPMQWVAALTVNGRFQPPPPAARAPARMPG
jgi:creatinine amidohydrolase